MGMGAFAEGLGTGDLMSARAGAIRAESMMELNEYLYQSRMLHRQRYLAQSAQEDAAEDRAREELADRVLNDPTPEEIASGDGAE